MRKNLEITPTGAASALDLAVLVTAALATASPFPADLEGVFTASLTQNSVSVHGTLARSS